MIARSAAAATIIHFAQTAGQKKTASTTMPRASRKRQKHNFMIFLSFRHKFSLSYEKKIYDSSIKLIKNSTTLLQFFSFMRVKQAIITF